MRTLSRAIDTGFQRLQFTPDLLPADIVGMVNAHAAHGTTAILPTTLAAPPEAIRGAVRAIRVRPLPDAQSP